MAANHSVKINGISSGWKTKSTDQCELVLPKVGNFTSWDDAIGHTQHHLQNNLDGKKKPASDQALDSTLRKGNHQGQRNRLTESSRKFYRTNDLVSSTNKWLLKRIRGSFHCGSQQVKDPMRMQFLSLASLIGSRIRHCHKLQHSLQMRLGSNITVAVM